MAEPLAPVPVPASAYAAETDAGLVTRVATGDEAALGALFDRHGATAHALARVLVGTGGEADDVVAGVFAQIWRTAARYDVGRGSVAAWITTMTRSRALDLLRSQRRRTRLHERAAAGDAEGFALPVGGTSDAPDRDAERAEVAHAVRASLATLPEAQRRAIELAFFGGMSHSDVAAALGEPLGTVKTRIRSGMLKLRDSLRPIFAGGHP